MTIQPACAIALLVVFTAAVTERALGGPITIISDPGDGSLHQDSTPLTLSTNNYRYGRASQSHDRQDPQRQINRLPNC